MASSKITDKDVFRKKVLKPDADILELVKKASLNILKDKNLMMICASKDGYVIPYFDDSLKDDEDIFLVSLKESNCLNAIEQCSDRLANDETFLLKTVAIYASCLFYMNSKMRTNVNIIQKAIQTNPLQAWNCMVDTSRENIDVLLTMLENNAIILQEKIKTNISLLKNLKEEASKKSNLFFIHAFQNMDIEHQEDISKINPASKYNSMIDFVLSHISLKDLKDLQPKIKNDYLKARVEYDLKLKVVSNMKLTGKQKVKSRKIF